MEMMSTYEVKKKKKSFEAKTNERLRVWLPA